jgi:hypothetical protein
MEPALNSCTMLVHFSTVCLCALDNSAEGIDESVGLVAVERIDDSVGLVAPLDVESPL